MLPRLLALAASGCLLLLDPVSVLAASTRTTGESTPLNLPADTAGSTKIASSGGGGSLVRTIVGLAVVIGVIYGIAWILRQVKASKEERTSGYGLEHAATIPLGPNRSLHLVRAGRELVLVGSAEQGVVPIRTYTEDEAIELGLLPEPGAEPAPVAPTALSVPAAAAKATATGLVARLRDLTVRT